MAKRMSAVDREMAKLKAMGVTVSVSLAPGVPGGAARPAHIISDAAGRAGILENAPHATIEEADRG